MYKLSALPKLQIPPFAPRILFQNDDRRFVVEGKTYDGPTVYLQGAMESKTKDCLGNDIWVTMSEVETNRCALKYFLEILVCLQQLHPDKPFQLPNEPIHDPAVDTMSEL